jgi:hypothetical protein
MCVCEKKSIGNIFTRWNTIEIKNLIPREKLDKMEIITSTCGTKLR